MKSLKTMTAGVAVAVALVGALAVPAMAVAVPGNGASMKASTSTAATIKPRWAAVNRYRVMARGRANQFNNTTRQVNRRLTRLSRIASYCAARGADVTTPTAEIAAARLHLANAKSLEASAVALTKAVPYSHTPGVAMARANKAWSVARLELAKAKADTNRAARHLQAIVRHLRLTWKFKAAAFK